MKYLKILLVVMFITSICVGLYYGPTAYTLYQIKKNRYIAPEDLSNTASPSVHVLEDFIQVPYLGEDRTIRVYIPPNYDQKPGLFYPVIYFYDGQFLFNQKTVGEHEWQVDETIDRLVNAGNQGAIVVGIDHSSDRTNEYNPFPENHNVREDSAHGDQFANFVATQLKRRIDSLYRTLPGPESTTIGGASFGANMAFYTLNKYPSIFHHALVLSPALWASDEYWNLNITPQNIDQYKIYINVGEYEGRGMRRDAKRLFNNLRTNGFSSKNLRFDVVEDLDHTQLTWRDGFKKAYPWILE